MLRALWKASIRTLAFVRKEIFGTLRQPRLILVLVLGPFLILLIFGIGYRNEARSLRTLFVAPKDSQLEEQVEEYASSLGPQLIYMGVTDDPELALDRLKDGEVELVAIAPDNAVESINAGEHAKFTLYHREIDPFQVNYVSFFGETYIAEVNRRVLSKITSDGQAEAATLNEQIQAAQENTRAVEESLQAGDEIAARQNLNQVTGNLNQISMALGASLATVNTIDETLGGDNSMQASEIRRLLDDVDSLTRDLQNEEINSENSDQWESQVENINSDLTELESQLETFTQLNPNVIVQPFTIELRNVAAVQPDATEYYAPAVIALLLQHLAVTIAGLSIVQESNFGTLELFRVSPLSAAETLIGKYLSYLILTTLIAAALTALLHFGLGVPMLGNWLNYGLVMILLIFTSLGIGFVISMLSQTDSQAVQYTMIVLLTSVFFSGFLMNLNMFWEPVRVLSWGIPTTYGIVMLREIALRGTVPDLLLFGSLAAIGVVIFMIAWLLLRRKLSRH